MKEKTKNIFQYIGPPLIAGAMLSLIPLACLMDHRNGKSDYEKMVERKDIVYEETCGLLEEAKTLSAGEDRIWSDTEKRAFLDGLGIKDVLGTGQDVYFRRNKTKRDKWANQHSTDVDIFLGNRLDNNGSFLQGSSAKSGTYIGTVNKATVQKFVNYHNKTP